MPGRVKMEQTRGFASGLPSLVECLGIQVVGNKEWQLGAYFGELLNLFVDFSVNNTSILQCSARTSSSLNFLDPLET